MADEDAYVAATQETIGNLITKPKMTEKYLKKPPFRFLHDIVMEVTKKTTFGQGLFSPEECDAANLSDKTAKLDFLNKAISVTCFALGETIDVSANKIVAGLEPEKTNAWLQRLHAAAISCAGEKSDAAVARVQGGELVGAGKEKKKKPKEDAPPPPPEDAAAEEEARKKEERRRKKEEEKRRKEEEEAAAAAAAEAPAPPAPAPPDEDEERKKEERRRKEEEREERRRRKEEEKRRQDEEQRLAQERAALEAQAAAEEQRRLEEAQAPQEDEAPAPPAGALSEGPFASADEIAQRAEQALAQRGDTGRPRTAGRKPPKVNSKVTTTEQSTTPSNVAAPVVIAEGGDDDQEDMFETGGPGPGAPPPPPPPVDDGQHGALVSDLLLEKKKEEERENRERLKKEEEDTREDFDDGKGIKMKLRRKKDAGSALADVDPVKLGESIQSLCQAANPLGKSMDLVHQDIANMGKELDHWKQAYREASDAYTRQLKMTEDQLQPLYQQIAELDDKIAEQKSKIRNSRSRISKNDLKVQQLLESVVMVR